MAETVLPGLERRLKAQLLGDVAFDPFTRGRYATDASHYQIMPLGVVAPRSVEEAEHAIALARDEGVSVTARGGGTSQCGQTINSSLIVDCSKYLDHIVELDVAGRRCVVEPGIVLDELNRRLKPHGLWFPVDISTASRATIGGMVGNNSCGARSLRYGNTRENVLSVDALLADGSSAHFGPVAPDLSDLPGRIRRSGRSRAISWRSARATPISSRSASRRCSAASAATTSTRFLPGRNELNLAHILVGSEGTLGFSTRIELKLSPLLGRRAVGAVHFGSFHTAMDAAQHIVKLGPIAVELVDRTMLGLAREIAMFQPTIDAVVHGDPEAILFVEFAEDDRNENFRRLLRLDELIGDLGIALGQARREAGRRDRGARSQAADRDHRDAHRRPQHHDVDEGGGQAGLLRRGLRGAARASRRLHRKLTDIFEKHGTRGTWYAHASVGCLHVRPVLNLRLDKDVKAMRAIAEEAFDLVRAYKGSHSGEHGDGIVRSEFHEKMFGPRAGARLRGGEGPLRSEGPVQSRQDRARAEIRRPQPVALRRRTIASTIMPTQLDWSAYPGAGGGFQGAVEMCNNNGACRALAGRRDVPELSRHPRRARRDARARQHAAARHHRAARTGRASRPTRWRRR